MGDASPLPPTPKTPNLTITPYTDPRNFTIEWKDYNQERLKSWRDAGFPKEGIPMDLAIRFENRYNVHLHEHPEYNSIIRAWKEKDLILNTANEIFTSHRCKTWAKSGFPPSFTPPHVLTIWKHLLGDRSPNTSNRTIYVRDLLVLYGEYREFFSKEHIDAACNLDPPTETSPQPATQGQASTSTEGTKGSSSPMTVSFAEAAERANHQMERQARGSPSPPPGSEGLIPPLQRTKCIVTKRDIEGRRPPISDQPYTLWWDLHGLNIPQSVILEVLDEQPIVGWSHRPGQEWVELAYETVPARDAALKEIITFPNFNQTVTPVKSRRIGGPEVFIQLVNVPQNRNAENEIREVFAEYGYITALAPVTYSDSKTGKWSRRWNMILSIPDDTDFIMHPIISIVGCDVAVFWQGGTPVCSICFTKGHYSQKCNPNYRRKSNKKRRNRLQPTPRISNDKQQIIKEAKRKSEEEGMSLVDAIAEVAITKGQMTEETIRTVKEATDALTLVARLQAEGMEDEITTREEAELQSQVSLANRGFAQLPTQNEFQVVKSRGQQKRERQQAKTQAQSSSGQSLPQPSSSRTPRSTTPTTKHPQSNPTTPSKGGERKRQKTDKRSNVSQDACCLYYHQVASTDKKEVEKVWRMTPSQYSEFKSTWDNKTYKNISDWERKHKPVVFDPSIAGIQTQRGRSPSPTPKSTNPSPPTATEKPNLYSRNKKNAVPTIPTAKFRLLEGDRHITINFEAEVHNATGQK